MPAGRHAKNTPAHWIVAAAAVLAILGSSVAVAESLTTTPSPDPTSVPSTAPTPGSPPAPPAAQAPARVQQPRPGGPPGAGDLAGCRGAWRAQAATLQAAGRSLAQWRVHVGTMNRLVAGEISMAQAIAIWDRTRVGAAARVVDFDRAHGAYAAEASACAGPAGGSAAPEPPPWPAECVAMVGARDGAVGAATVAVTTWKRHIRDMVLLRAGRMTPERATRLWLRSWRQGVRELDAFAAAHDHAADSGCAGRGTAGQR